MSVSVIGCGNLGSSFIKGLVNSGTFPPGEIIASDPDEAKLRELEELGVDTTTSNEYAARNSEVIFIAVEPDIVGEVLEELDISDEKLVVSLAAGVPTDLIDEHTNARIIRVMPNICVSEAEMASAYSLGPRAKKGDEARVKDILKNLGRTVEIDEDQMDLVTGLSGAGPAFVFLVIQALKEGGQSFGLSEEKAVRLAAQTVKGSGEKVLESEESLEELIDRVCTPGGATIEGVKVLEDRKVQEAFKNAVRAAEERAKELSK